MINHLNNMLRHLFMAQINQITEDSQVRFQPPDEDWRTYAKGLQRNALDILLLGEKDISDGAHTSGGTVSYGPSSGLHPKAIPISSVIKESKR